MPKIYIMILLEVVFPISILLLVFGTRYLTYKERMALIERNRDLKDTYQPTSILTRALLLIGGGLGLLSGAILTRIFGERTEPVILYLLSVSFFSGLGLLISYLINQKKRKQA